MRAPAAAPDIDPLTASCPAAPLVPLTSESRDPFESVMTLALTPIPAELIAAASVARVVSLWALSTLKVCPWMVRLPESVSFGSAIALEASDEVCASELTSIVWLPADAVALAELRPNRFGLELDPCF